MEIKPISVLIYSRRGTEDWSNKFADYLRNIGYCVNTFSELRKVTDITLSNEFYKVYNTNKAIHNFSEEQINDIIQRCRLLRSLQYSKAVLLIGAMNTAIRELLDSKNPSYVIGLRVDSYVLDLLERLCKDRGIEYIGIWKSAFAKDFFFITSRGEINYLDYQNNIATSLDKIIQPSFKATSIAKVQNFGLAKSLYTKIYYISRSYLHFITRFIVRDHLGYRYLTNGIFVPEYRVSLFHIDYSQFVKNDWQFLLEQSDPQKNIFIALQVNPESTIDYYVKDLRLIEYENVLVTLLGKLTDGGYNVFVKDHPNMYGRRSFSFLKRMTRFSNVRFIPYNIDSTYVLERVQITFTWSGTIAVQSALQGKVSIVVNPPYFMEGLYLQIQSYNDIENILMKIEEFKLPDDLKNRQKDLVSLINRSLLKGNLNFKDVDTRLFESVSQIITKTHS